MNTGCKKKATVDTNAEQSVHGINKAMHSLRIHSRRKNLTFYKTVNPGIVRIHITKSVRIILKRAIAEIQDAEQHHRCKQSVLKDMASQNGHTVIAQAPEPVSERPCAVCEEALQAVGSGQQLLHRFEHFPFSGDSVDQAEDGRAVEQRAKHCGIQHMKQPQKQYNRIDQNDLYRRTEAEMKGQTSPFQDTPKHDFRPYEHNKRIGKKDLAIFQAPKKCRHLYTSHYP